MNALSAPIARRLADAEALMDAARANYDRGFNRHSRTHFLFQDAVAHYNRLCILTMPIALVARDLHLRRDWPAPTAGRPLISEHGYLAYTLELTGGGAVIVRTPGEASPGALTYPVRLYPSRFGWKMTTTACGRSQEHDSRFAFTRAGALRKASRTARKSLRKTAAALP